MLTIGTHTFPVIAAVAMDVKDGISREGTIPWKLPADLRAFQKETSHTTDPNKTNIVIMGRKTWDSIPYDRRPLKKRCNIVFTRDASASTWDSVSQKDRDVYVVKSLDEVKTFMSEDIDRWEKVFVIGGADIYKLFLDVTDECQVTFLHQDFDCDLTFPTHENFKRVTSSEMLWQNGIQFQFQKWIRNTS